MAETSSPCLVRSFSQPTSKSCNGNEGDLLRALTSSISFGRYMSESLAWEKWSAFTHNKYREEAERYARPGSVAEKKAFFEARYKKIAPKKPADSLEQHGASVDHSSNLGRVSQNYDDGSVDSRSAQNANCVGTEEIQGEVINSGEKSTEQSLKQLETDKCINKNMPYQYEKMDTKGTVAMEDSSGSDETTHSSTTTKPSTKCGLPKPLPVKPPSTQSKKAEHSSPSSSKQTTKGSVIKNQAAPRSLHVSINFEEHDEPTKTSSPVFQRIANSKFIRAITNANQESISRKSPIRESGISLSKQVTSEQDVHVCMDSESAENANHVDTEEMQGEELHAHDETAMKKQVEQATFSKNQVEPLKQQEIDGHVDKNASHLDEKMDTKDTVTMGDSPVTNETTHTSTTTKPSTKCGLPKPRPVKPPSIQSKKTEHSTPSSSMHATKGSAIKLKFAPQSLHVSVSFEHDEPIKTSSPILQKIANSKFFRAITNTTRECRSQKSPVKGYSYSSSKHVTSEPESRRARVMEDQPLAPSTGKSKPPTTYGSKSRPSTTCSSFVLRSEERAMKRKEFFEKLEQKLKEEQQLQTKGMSKRTNESTVLGVRVSRVNPNVTNHHTRDSSSNPVKKTPEMQPCSKVQDNSSRPPWRLPGKSDGFKDVAVKNNNSLFHSAKSCLKESRHENASPNIQL